MGKGGIASGVRGFDRVMVGLFLLRRLMGRNKAHIQPTLLWLQSLTITLPWSMDDTGSTQSGDVLNTSPQIAHYLVFPRGECSTSEQTDKLCDTLTEK